MSEQRAGGARPSQSPQSYVIRIYRRDARQPGRVAGTVEIVASGSEFPFGNLRELERILVGELPQAQIPPRK
ncbi:MAG: hypothetical protein ABI552_01130 [Casimicrobiaceae bacterium]